MDSTTGRPRDRQPRLVFDGEPDQTQRALGAQSRVSSDSNLYPAEPLHGFPSEATTTRPAQQEPHTPLWARRVWLVIYVLFCLELGMLLVVLPWTLLWGSNAFLWKLPALRNIVYSNFVRGLVSGIGVVDIWLGVSEAVNFREWKR